MFHLFAAILLTLIFGLPVLGLSELASVLPDSRVARAAFLVACPVLYAFGFVLTAGLASLPFHRSIVAGSFPRDLKQKAYRNRRFYGLCWTAVYYFTPVYWIFLTVPPLKTMLFRLFGYRGTMNFTVYPDTWIRDLPLLEFGEGAYVANKVTLGTNVCLNDGTILVNRISLAKGTMVGHMTVVGPGVVMEEGSDVGVGVALGMRVHLEPGVSIGARCGIGHLTRMEAGASTGTSVDVGSGSRIGPRIHVPGGTFVPNRTRWKAVEDMRADLSQRGGSPSSVPAAAAAGPDSAPSPSASSHGTIIEYRTHWNAFE